MRATPTLRRLVQETRLSVSDLIYPVFVTEETNGPRVIEPMPGIFQHSLDSLLSEIEVVADLGIPAVLVFGIPSHKDEIGSEGYAPNGIVQEAIRAIKQTQPDLAVIGDVCMCEYTSHGHCGILLDDGTVDNDRTLDLLAETAVSQAEAGVDIVAPSAMMDGQVGPSGMRWTTTTTTTCRSWPTRPSTLLRSTALSGRRLNPRPKWVTAGDTRWTPRT